MIIFIDQLIDFLQRDKDMYPNFIKAHINVHSKALRPRKSNEKRSFLFLAKIWFIKTQTVAAFHAVLFVNIHGTVCYEYCFFLTRCNAIL